MTTPKAGRQRRNNTGSIRTRGQDRWQLVYTMHPGTGEGRKQGYETVNGTRRAAEEALTGAHGLSGQRDTLRAFQGSWPTG